MACFVLSLIFTLSCVSFCYSENVYQLNIIHYNDFHARFEETNRWNGVCEPEASPCMGGFARLRTAITEALTKEPHSLVLFAGDSFQGTKWSDLLRWNVTQDFMNMIPHDAHALGNHEFDHGIEGVVPYLQHLKAVVLTANIIDTDEPTFQGLYKPSEVFVKNGRRVGVIGVLYAQTNTLAPTGKLIFTDEVEAVKREAEKLHNDGVDIIIVLSHSGFDIDQEIAANGGPYIDFIVGAHTHTLLYTGTPPGTTVSRGPYPYVVQQASGKSVPIVQASAFTEYLGEIKLYFDTNGTLLSWTGAPRYLSNDIIKDPEVEAKLALYRPLVAGVLQDVVGYSTVHLSGSCGCEECNLGDLFCDAILHSTLSKAEAGQWNYAHMCLIGRSGIRSAITSGNITEEKLQQAVPFSNMIKAFDLKGEYLWQTLEHAASDDFGEYMVQIGGAKVTLDFSSPAGSRVKEFKIRCIQCEVPTYEPLQMDKMYKVVTTDYLASGAIGFTILSENRQNVEDVGDDLTILKEYFNYLGNITQENDERLIMRNTCQWQ